MRIFNYDNELQYFSRYNWYLRSLNAKKAERRKILADISSGLISRDTLDEDWEAQLEREADEISEKLRAIERTIDEIPETPSLLPCKLFLRLHFVSRLNMTETAEKLNVSESTLRRIRDRAIRYFEENPPEN